MEEEGGFDCWDWNAYYDLLPAPSGTEADGPPLPPPLSSDSWAGSGTNDGQCPHQMMSADDGSWALDVQVLSTLDMVPTAPDGLFALQAEDWSLFGHDWIHGLPDQAQDQQFSLDIGGSSSGGDADSSGTSQACWGMDWLPPMAAPADAALDAGSPPAAPTTQEEEETTLADMVRMAEECGNDEAARTVWTHQEHKELLNRIHGYAELDVDERAHRCFDIAFYLPNKTAKDVALRWRWLQHKEKTAKQAEVVEKGSAGVKVKKDKEKTAKQAEIVEKGSAGVEVKKISVQNPYKQGTKGTKKNNNMYPLSKEALDSKITTRELLRDGYIFMQRIEEKIKAGEWGGDTADYFYYVKTIMDAVEKRGNEFCRISMPMPPIDEQGVEEILQESRHSSSASKEAGA